MRRPRRVGEAAFLGVGVRELDGVVLRPELVVEVTFDHTRNGRIRHGAKIVRWREDKNPRDCSIDQLAT